MYKFLENYSGSATTLTTMFLAFIWRLSRFKDFDIRITQMEKDIAVIKAVMIMKNIMPQEASKGEIE